MTWMSWILGCGPSVVLDFEATCAREWPADACEADCADTSLEEGWVAAFGPAFADAARISEAEVADHARIRSLGAAPTSQSISSASYQVDVGWVRLVRELELWTDAPGATDAELIAAWTEHLGAPAFDLDVDLMRYEEAQAWVDDCAAELGVTFDGAGWCAPWYPTDWDDDDSGLRFDFFVDLDSPEYALASVDVTGSEEPRCERRQATE